MNLQITSTDRDGTRTVGVSGEVDVSNASALREAIDKALEDGSRDVVVDLADVAYIDSTGIGVLVGGAQRLGKAGGSLRVTNPQRNVARVLSLLGVDKELGAARGSE